MWLSLLTFLKNPKIIGTIVLVLAVGGYITKLKFDVSNLKESVAEQQAARHQLEGKLHLQNAEVERLGKESKKAAEAASQRAKETLKKPLPTPTNPGVKAMNKWLEGV